MHERTRWLTLAIVLLFLAVTFYWYDGYCVLQPSFWDAFYPLDTKQVLKYRGLTISGDGYDEETLYVINTGVKKRSWKGTWYRVDSFAEGNGFVIAESKWYRACGDTLLIKEGDFPPVTFTVNKTIEHVDTIKGKVHHVGSTEIAVLESSNEGLIMHLALGVGPILAEAHDGDRLIYRTELMQVIPFSQSPSL